MLIRICLETLRTTGPKIFPSSSRTMKNSLDFSLILSEFRNKIRLLCFWESGTFDSNLYAWLTGYQYIFAHCNFLLFSCCLSLSCRDVLPQNFDSYSAEVQKLICTADHLGALMQYDTLGFLPNLRIHRGQRSSTSRKV